MKRLGISVAIAAVLGLAAYTMAGAQGPERQGFGGPGMHGPHGFGRGAGMLLRGLDLDANQQEQIKAIRESARDAAQDPPAEVQLHRQLQSELFADTPDPARLAALQQQLLQAHSARLAKRVALEQKIAQVLTADQRATIRERLADEPERRGFRGRR